MYIYLITLYQIIECYGHYKLYNLDYSWIDIEGYIIGFTFTTLMNIYLEYKPNEEVCKI